MSAKPTYEELEQTIKELTTALQESEEKYLTLVENVNVGILVAQKMKLVFVNSTISEFLGYDKKDLIDLLNPIEFIHPEDREMVVERHLRRLKGEKVPITYPYRVITKDGSVKWVEVTGKMIHWKGQPASLNVFTDITDRIRAEDELREAKDYLENVFENSADAIGIVDQQGNFIKWNKMAAELYGYEFEEMLGKSSFEIYADKAELEKMLGQLRRYGFVREYEIDMRKKDGSIAPFNLSISVIRDKNKNNIGSFCVARDLSEIRKAREAIRESEERYRMLSDATGEGVILIEDGNILVSNQVFATMFGYDHESVLGMEAVSFIALNQRELFLEHILTGYEKPYEVDGIKKDGTCFPVEICAKTVGYHGRIVRQIAIRNLSLQKQAEKEKVSHEKLQGVLEMAGAVCHELNQPLMAILGYSELILMDEPQNDNLSLKAGKIREQTDRLGKITQKLMRITKYETKNYLEGKIIDIEKAAE